MDYWKDFDSNAKWLNVFQKDYDFLVIESKTDIKVSDEVHRMANRVGFKTEHNDFFDKHFLKTFRIKTIRQFEIVFLGYSYVIYRDIGKDLINFDAKKYVENLEKFKSKYPELAHEAEFLYNRNTQLIADFFLCDVDKLKEGKINLFHQSNKRLMFNINNR